MIGKIMTGKSLYYCLKYCLEDKRELTEEMKKNLSEMEHVQHLNRAEVLEYNQCFGDLKDLTEQMKDVRNLSRRVEKPVLHMTLSLSPDEKLTREQWTAIGRQCAREFGVEDNQYVTILHKDTEKQHVHIVANRVGFDGRAAKDGNNYKRMAAFCRRMEKQFQLQEVLSPRQFLAPKERLIPRNDQRKKHLKADILKSIKQVSTFSDFRIQMEALGYQVIKGRGISFIDSKKVRTKGSEINFSLATINRILDLQNRIKIESSMKKKPGRTDAYKPEQSKSSPSVLTQNADTPSVASTLVHELGLLFFEVMKSEVAYYGESYPNLYPPKKKRKKRKQQHL